MAQPHIVTLCPALAPACHRPKHYHGKLHQVKSFWELDIGYEKLKVAVLVFSRVNLLGPTMKLTGVIYGNGKKRKKERKTDKKFYGIQAGERK